MAVVTSAAWSGAGATRGQRITTRMASAWVVVVLVWALTVAMQGCAGPPRTPAYSENTASEASGGKVPEDAGTPRVSSTTPPAFSVDQVERAAHPAIADPEMTVCLTEDGAEWASVKARYSDPGNVHPQIIQGNDYEPIQAIQLFYEQISGTSKPGAFGTDDHRDFDSDGSKITIVGSGRVTVDVSEKAVTIGSRSFRDPSTSTLFRTLGRLLRDVGLQCKRDGVRGMRLGTRSYRDSTRIQFAYGPIVVTLESASNGRGDPERLYVLDIIEAEDSLLWAGPN